jgi:photosystem II stability/assembly factor-like uncharacterized protein
VRFYDNDKGYIAGFKGSLFSTMNGGKTWQTENTYTDIGLYTVSFNGEQNVIVGGELGTILMNELPK